MDGEHVLGRLGLLISKKRHFFVLFYFHSLDDLLLDYAAPSFMLKLLFLEFFCTRVDSFDLSAGCVVSFLEICLIDLDLEQVTHGLLLEKTGGTIAMVDLFQASLKVIFTTDK